MDIFAKILGSVTVVGIVLFFVCLIGTVMGALAGWIVGLVFPETLGLLAKMLNVDAAPWQLGAILGFIGGFFRSSLSKD